MNVEDLRNIPPWEWPEGAGPIFLDILRDGQAAESDRLVAAELTVLEPRAMAEGRSDEDDDELYR